MNNIENRVIIITPTIFSTKPTRTIWLTVTRPDEKIIAFGGVLTGSINAQDAASVTGMHNCITEYSSEPAAKMATIGTNT
jgi:hypothetical protein